MRTNPILTGKLIEVKKSPWPWDRRSEIHVVPNAYPPETHSFVTVVDPPAGMPSPGDVLKEGSKDLFEFVHSNVGPNMLDRPDFTFEQIEKGSPLFEGEY